MMGRCTTITLIAVASCASTRVVIEKPIADQCESTGLKGCPDLTEGVLLFVEGHQSQARHKLHLAVNANEPDEVLAFANGLKLISQIPGAGQFTAPIQQVVDILATEARQATDHPVVKRRKPTHVATKSSARTRSEDDESDLVEVEDAPAARVAASGRQARGPRPASVIAPPATHWQPGVMDFDGKTVVPAIEEGNRSCALTGIMSPSGESSKGYCVRVMKGPLVVTDLHSSTACPAELFALAVVLPGDLSAPRWAVYAQPANAISVSSVTLVVRDTEHFVIGAMSTVDQKIKRDIRCAITWSGWRPQVPAAEQAGQPSATRQP